MRSRRLYLMSLIVLLAASVAAAKPKTPVVQAVRNVQDYNYKVLASNLVEAEGLAVSPDGRLFVVQRAVYQATAGHRVKDTRSSVLWPSYGNRQAVYEYTGGRLVYRFAGADDLWGARQSTYLATDNLHHLFVYGTTWIDNFLAVYDLRTNRRLYRIANAFPPEQKQSANIDGLIYDPKRGLLYFAPFTFLEVERADVFIPSKRRFDFALPDLQPGETLAFDSQGNQLKLKPAESFPGQRAKESLEEAGVSPCYDAATGRELHGGEIWEMKANGWLVHRGFVVLEKDRQTGELHKVLEARGDIGIFALTVDSRGNIYLISGPWADPLNRPPYRQLIKLERRG